MADSCVKRLRSLSNAKLERYSEMWEFIIVRGDGSIYSLFATSARDCAESFGMLRNGKRETRSVDNKKAG